MITALPTPKLCYTLRDFIRAKKNFYPEFEKGDLTFVEHQKCLISKLDSAFFIVEKILPDNNES